MNLHTWTKRLVLLAALMGLGVGLTGCSSMGRKQTNNDYRPPSSYGYYENTTQPRGTW